MADVLVVRAAAALRSVSFPDAGPQHTRTLSEMSEMSEPIPIPQKRAATTTATTATTATLSTSHDPNSLSPQDSRHHARASISSAGSSPPDPRTPGSPYLSSASMAGSPRLSRNPSFTSSGSFQEDWEAFPPLDKLTVFDLLDNFALPQQLEKIQNVVSKQTQKVRQQREALKSRSSYAKERVVEQWRKRVPTADEQLEKYRRRMRESVDKLGRRWNDTKAVTLREKFSFIGGVWNIFISGYIIGALPEYFHVWYTAQLMYFMPIRWYTYQKRGYHYFLADLCYFVNFLLLLSIWVFPTSKRLLLTTFCLAFGNNAVAIAMWRNSMVFHSLDKVTSLFIHIMPCVTLHCMVHLTPDAIKAERFPAIYAMQQAKPNDPEHYSLFAMQLWSTIPYMIWQLSYHFLITVRRREKIAAGRPTSFTWLRKSYSKAWIGRFVTSLPDYLQEPCFMMIQYIYALFTMLPCPIWFWYRWPSAAFLCVVFAWSIYNGATYYIDVFGKRFQNELEAMKREVQKWQNSPDMASPLMTPGLDHGGGGELKGGGLGEAALDSTSPVAAAAMAGMTGVGMTPMTPLGMMAEREKEKREKHERSSSVDKIPLLTEDVAGGTGLDGGARDVARERRVGEAVS